MIRGVDLETGWMEARVPGQAGAAFFKILNALCGAGCIVAGLQLSQIDMIHIIQPPGEDAFRLIQAHWIAAGIVSILVSLARPSHQLWSALLLAWLLLNGWLGASALMRGDPAFAWVLIFPVVAFLNFFQVVAQAAIDGEPNIKQDDMPAGVEDEPQIPADFFEVRPTSAPAILAGMLQIIILIGLQITLLIGFFFYGALLVNIIFEGASADFPELLDRLSGAFQDIFYIPAIIAAVYIIVLFCQAIVEKIALSGVSQDVNRALSTQERGFIKESLQRIEAYLEEAEFPRIYGWFFWPSFVVLLCLMLGVPSAIVWFEMDTFDVVEMAGVAPENVIASAGPAVVGGAIFGFLLGVAAYWAGHQWFGARYRRFGEYLHMRWGWNSMNSEPRPLETYAKILTRYIRTRKYTSESPFEPQQFIRDAYDEFSGIIYKSVIFLAAATAVFTVLDVNWRRVAHLDGLHYSPYFDTRGYALSLDDVIKVELRCFLYAEDDAGIRKPGVGYDLVFSNGMRGWLLSGEKDDSLLSNLEAVDARLRERDIVFVRAERAGPFILRGIGGYRPDCVKTVLSRLDSGVRPRIARLLHADLEESPGKN